MIRSLLDRKNPVTPSEWRRDQFDDLGTDRHLTKHNDLGTELGRFGSQDLGLSDKLFFNQNTHHTLFRLCYLTSFSDLLGGDETKVFQNLQQIIVFVIFRLADRRHRRLAEHAVKQLTDSEVSFPVGTFFANMCATEPFFELKTVYLQ